MCSAGVGTQPINAGAWVSLVGQHKPSICLCFLVLVCTNATYPVLNLGPYSDMIMT